MIVTNSYVEPELRDMPWALRKQLIESDKTKRDRVLGFVNGFVVGLASTAVIAAVISHIAGK